ncbi:MAG: hypothetical protein V4581_14950 [Bacteroidota bacterium]
MKKLLLLAVLCFSMGFTCQKSGYNFAEIVKQFKASGQFDPNSKFTIDDVLYNDIIIINEKNASCENAYIAWCPKDTVSTLFMISKQCNADLSGTEHKSWDYKIRDGRIKMTIATQTAAEAHTLTDESLVTTQTGADEFTFAAVRNFTAFPKINYPE